MHRALALILGSIVAALPAPSGVAGVNEQGSNCRHDAMLVFDASGSMSGTDWNSVGVPRIARVKDALAVVLPEVARLRRLGLIVYGPGPYNHCNIDLKLHPVPDAANLINQIVASVNPAGKTPLTEAVRLAADVLDWKHRPAVIVLLTDGEETCGGTPCTSVEQLRTAARDLTVHVIGYIARENVSGRGLLVARCLADKTGGLYISVETADELIAALRRTLGCPLLTKHEAEPPRYDARSPSVARALNEPGLAPEFPVAKFPNCKPRIATSVRCVEPR